MTSEPLSGEEPESSGAAEPPDEPQSPPASGRARKAKGTGKGAAAEPNAAAPPPGAGTPEGEQLALATRAFELGDYARVRQLCNGLREARQDDVARAARELDARTRVDPVQIAVLCACLAFFLWIAYVYVIR